MSEIKKQLEIGILEEMSYEEINDLLNKQNDEIKALKDNNAMLTDIVNSRNSISDDDVSELMRFINDELPQGSEWWSDGYEDFETLGKDMLAKGFNIENIKLSFESVYNAVSCEFGG